MSGSVLVWRIAADTPDLGSDDMSGEGAMQRGGRWNRKRVPLLYASGTRALACLETMVHLGTNVLPLNRYLVELTIPDLAWQSRTVFDRSKNVGWNAEPAGRISLDWGTSWAREGGSLVAEVPSVIVPEESNVLVNPLHPGISSITVRKIRRWMYDVRVGPVLRRIR